MKLAELIKDINVKEIIGNTDVEILGLKTDSNFVSDGDLFICLSGCKFNGHDFAKQALFYGASAIITEKKLPISIPQVIVQNSRVAMSEISANFYSHPDKKMKIIGVTGTNGKTTTTHLIKKIFETAGVKCGMIGTLGSFYCDKFIEPTLTTPDPIELYKILADMVNDGVKVVIMEVSAHALHLDKLYGLRFEVGVFTNFTQDHLDYFGSMEEYKKSKLKFFTDFCCKYKVLNVDDSSYNEFAKASKESISYGIYNPSDVFAMDVEDTERGESFILNLFDSVYDVEIALKGDFNVYNSLAAITATAVMGVSVDDIVEGLESVNQVSGRMEKVYDEEFSVFIDYAHTPDGLKKALLSLKNNYGKLICVFGCGGNRDKTKREPMGVISGRYADFTVITSDNPRFEEPMEIIFDVEKGVLKESKEFVTIQDRKQAIEYALDLAKKGDTVLIAGKGSEKYQEILGIKHVFKDKDIIEEILRSKKVD